MKLLRFIAALAVIAYAGWLAWPLISPFFEGGGAGAAIEMSRAEASIEAAGNMPRTLIWGAAILLYVLSAFLLGGGNPRAFIAYLLGFMADAALRLAMSGDGGAADVAARSAEAAPAGVDPTWFVLGALLLGAVVVFWLSRRRRRARAAPLALQDA